MMTTTSGPINDIIPGGTGIIAKQKIKPSENIKNNSLSFTFFDIRDMPKNKIPETTKYPYQKKKK